VEKVHDLFAGVGRESYPTVDVSADDWLRQKGATDKMVSVADACYANDFGCSIAQLGLREMIKENRSWESGALKTHKRSPPLLRRIVICT
jgi:hypothetical protein